MAKQQDYYEILEVSRNASEADIKKAYRRLAMKYHPDRNANGDKESEERFKEIQQAYAILSDSQKRAAYDQFGHAGVDPSSGFSGFSGGNFNDIIDDVFGEVFGDIFGGRGRGRSSSTARPGADLRYDLSISLEKAVKGGTIEIRVPTYIGCKECNGSGAQKGSSPIACEDCGGIGQVRIQQGFFTVQQTCPTCRGVGKVIKNPCRQCHGQGRVQSAKTLSVKIPAGVDNGDRIRLTGEGEAGMNGGPAGDLYVFIQVEPHHIFSRDGRDLHCEVPIAFTTAILGGEIEVPTLDGRVKLKIPAETQTGKLFRLREKGVRSVRGGGPGDLICRVVVETPVNLNKKQKELLEELERSMQENVHSHSPRSMSWFDRVKTFFEDMKL